MYIKYFKVFTGIKKIRHFAATTAIFNMQDPEIKDSSLNKKVELFYIERYLYLSMLSAFYIKINVLVFFFLSGLKTLLYAAPT